MKKLQRKAVCINLLSDFVIFVEPPKRGVLTHFGIME